MSMRTADLEDAILRKIRGKVRDFVRVHFKQIIQIVADTRQTTPVFGLWHPCRLHKRRAPAEQFAHFASSCGVAPRAASMVRNALSALNSFTNPGRGATRS